MMKWVRNFRFRTCFVYGKVGRFDVDNYVYREGGKSIRFHKVVCHQRNEYAGEFLAEYRRMGIEEGGWNE